MPSITNLLKNYNYVNKHRAYSTRFVLDCWFPSWKEKKTVTTVIFNQEYCFKVIAGSYVVDAFV